MNVHPHHLRLKQSVNREHKPYCHSPCFEWCVPFTSLLPAWSGLEETSSPRNAWHSCSRIVIFTFFFVFFCILQILSNRHVSIYFITRKEKYVFHQHQLVRRIAVPRQPLPGAAPSKVRVAQPQCWMIWGWIILAGGGGWRGGCHVHGGVFSSSRGQWHTPLPQW